MAKLLIPPCPTLSHPDFQKFPTEYYGKNRPVSILFNPQSQDKNKEVSVIGAPGRHNFMALWEQVEEGLDPRDGMHKTLAQKLTKMIQAISD